MPSAPPPKSWSSGGLASSDQRARRRDARGRRPTCQTGRLGRLPASQRSRTGGPPAAAVASPARHLVRRLGRGHCDTGQTGTGLASALPARE
jgi:hypothetical protein